MPNPLSAELSGSALVQAATAILRADSLEEALDALTEAARGLIGAHLGLASISEGDGRLRQVQAVSLSDKFSQWRGLGTLPKEIGIYRFLSESNCPIRLTQAELEAHPSWRGCDAARDRHPPLRGCLAAPLLRRDGSNMGLVQLSDRFVGEFTANDEALLVQLVQVAAAAIETQVALEHSRLEQRRFHDFARSASDWIWELDSDLRFTCAPPLPWEGGDDAQGHLGIRPWELPGIESDHPHWRKNKEDLLGRRPFRDFQFEWRYSDNRRRVLSVSAQPVFDQTGAFLGYRGVGRDLTEQVEARRQAELADARLAQAIEGLHDGFILWDADHRLVVANSCAQQLNRNHPSLVRTGITFEEYLRGVAFSGEAPEILGREEEWLARRLKNRELGGSLLLKRGEKWWLARDHRMADGGFATIVTDVTSGKLATEALREREARLLLALGAAEMGTWDWDTVADFVHCNDTQSDLLGVPRGEPVPVAQILSLIHPDDLSTFQAVIFRARDLTGHYEHEFRIVRPDGATRWLASRSRTLGEIGQSTRMIGVSFDVTEKKEAEQALRASEALQKQQAEILHSIIESMGDGVYVADAERKMLLVNPAGASMLGYSPVDLIGRTYPAVTGKHYQADGARFLPDAERPLTKALRGEPTDGFEFMLKRENVELIIAATARPIRGDDGAVKGAVAVLRDVTEQRRTQRALAQAQKMEAVGQLTGGIAHDFNNMLAVMLGNVEMALELPLDPNAALLLKTAQRAALRGAELTSRLLAFSRQQTLLPERIDVNRLVIDMVGLLRRTLGETIQVETKLDPQPMHVSVDAGQLENALLNLAVNARDAMQAGGVLSIATSSVVLDEDYAGKRQDVAPGAYRVISVSDSGIGMTAAVKERVFEPFFTTKDMGKGTGLGLAMVYGFVKQSDGHVTIYSEPGHGTTVRLYLPVSPEDRQQEELAPAPSAEAFAEGQIVLVVEDDDDVRAVIATMVARLGFSPIIAADGPEALKTLEGSAHLDLLITDVVMPKGMSGLDLAAAAHASRPHLPVLFVSGYSDETEALAEVVRSGAALLSKPFSRAQFAWAIKTAMRGRQSEGT